MKNKLLTFWNSTKFYSKERMASLTTYLQTKEGRKFGTSVALLTLANIYQYFSNKTKLQQEKDILQQKLLTTENDRDLYKMKTVEAKVTLDSQQNIIEKYKVDTNLLENTVQTLRDDIHLLNTKHAAEVGALSEQNQTIRDTNNLLMTQEKGLRDELNLCRKNLGFCLTEIKSSWFFCRKEPVQINSSTNSQNISETHENVRKLN